VLLGFLGLLVLTIVFSAPERPRLAGEMEVTP
jgi:hypothetical protein